MIELYVGLFGILAFVLGAAVLGTWLRMSPTKGNAERSSRVMHFLFFAGLIGLPMIPAVYPGVSQLDTIVGLPALPVRPASLAVGIVLAVPGLYLLAVSNKLLRHLGSGANAFRLTKQVVVSDIYRRTRNPMSLGYYLCSLSFGLISGSTVATLAAVLGTIPAHLFFLTFFEEQELELRFGASYREYKRKVPFLIPRLPAD